MFITKRCNWELLLELPKNNSQVVTILKFPETTARTNVFVVFQSASWRVEHVKTSKNELFWKNAPWKSSGRRKGRGLPMQIALTFEKKSIAGEVNAMVFLSAKSKKKHWNKQKTEILNSWNKWRFCATLRTWHWYHSLSHCGSKKNSHRREKKDVIMLA